MTKSDRRSDVTQSASLLPVHSPEQCFSPVFLKLGSPTAKYAACVLTNTIKTCSEVLKVLLLKTFFGTWRREGGVVFYVTAT